MTTKAEENLSEAQERALFQAVNESQRRLTEGYDEDTLYRVPDHVEVQTRDALARKGLVASSASKGSPWDGNKLTARGRQIGEALVVEYERDNERTMLVRRMVGFDESQGVTLEDLVAQARAIKGGE